MKFPCKHRLWLLLASLVAIAILAACGARSTTENAPTPADASVPVATEAAPAEAVAEAPAADVEAPMGEIKTLFVGSNLVECTGVAPQQCMLVKENPDDEYLFFYNSIQGFEFEEGYEYELLVQVTPVENPPADGSALSYELIKIVSQTPAGAGADNAEAMSYTLEGVLWRVEAMVDDTGATVDVPADVEIAARFENGQVTGAAGCNNYFGSYETSDNELSIIVGGATLMACPEELMAMENLYLSALDKVALYSIVGDQLELGSPDGKLLLRYGAVTPMSLTGTVWQATLYNNGNQALVSPIAGTQITAVFGEDGSLSGTAGCNNYQATYTIDGETITIGPALTTRKMCPEPEGVMEQEQLYLAALAQAATYRIEGDDLELFDATSTRLATYVAAVPVQALSAEGLANATFQTGVTASGEAQLVNGEYREPAADGAASEIIVSLTENIALGELNGVPSAAAVLVSSGGGTGSFYNLAVVQEVEGAPKNVASTQLGDRIEMQSLAIENNQILVGMITQGPEDPMCCPTQEVVQTYDLQDGNLVLTSTTNLGTVTSAEKPDGAAGAELVGTTWQWLQTLGGDDSLLEVPNPAVYTVLFNADGSVNIQADCNVAIGAYTAENGSLNIQLGPMTMAACPPESLSDTFLQQLRAAASYIFDGDNLFINMFADAGGMKFATGDATMAQAEAPSSELSANPWEWLGTSFSNDTELIVKFPSRYSVDFLPAGTLALVVDCNTGGGKYAVDGSSLSIEVGGTTRKACPRGSKGADFVQQLNNAASYIMQDGKLIINLKADTGNMSFQPALDGAR